MGLKKIILVTGAVVIVLGGGAGGALFMMGILPPHTANSASAKPKVMPPKPIYFAELADVVVSVPADSDDSSSSFVQFAVQFSTYDQNALTTFGELQPIIKSEIISLLMTETGKSLTDPATRAALTKNCLTISNTVLTHNANYAPANPFTAAYITNLVVQD
jgi:flagellar basal body-associated protein FliL